MMPLSVWTSGDDTEVILGTSNLKYSSEITACLLTHTEMPTVAS